MGNAYDSASLLVTPNGYKASKIYSAKPTDGTGDLAFSRASTAMRRNSAGLWEEVANNVPRLQYPVGGGCPSWLFEPQATNEMLYSTDFSNAVWVVGGTAAKNPSALPSNIVGGIAYDVTGLDNSFSQNFYQFFSSATNKLYQVFIRATVVGDIGKTVRLDTNGGGSINVVLTADWSEVSYFASVSSNALIFYGNPSTGTPATQFTISYAARTSLTVATSPIITAGSAVTRLADETTSPDISALLGSYLSVATSFERTFIGRGTLFELNENNAGDNIVRVDLESGGNIFITVVKSGVVVVNAIIATYAINTYYKVALIYDGTYKFFINGTLTYTSALFDLPENLDRIHYGQVRSASGYHLNGITDLLDITPAALSNTEAEELTTL
jgi:hypothetical protein